MTYLPPPGDRPPSGPVPPYYGQGGGGGGRARPSLALVITIAVVVVAAGIGAAFAFTGGKSNSNQGQHSASQTVPGTRTTTRTTASSSPATTTGSSTPATEARSHKCSMPADAVAAPSLRAPGVLATTLGHQTLTTPAYRYTTSTSDGTLNTYCYDKVDQFDLVLVLSYLDGAGYTQTPGTTPDNQQVFRTSGTLKPALIVITVTGTIQIDEKDYDNNTGSVEFDWR